jgi:hypothetical protein
MGMIIVKWKFTTSMAVAKSGARGTQSLIALSSGGCSAAKPHYNHQKELFGEAKPPQTHAKELSTANVTHPSILI